MESLKKYLDKEEKKDLERQKAMKGKKLVNSLGIRQVDRGAIVLAEAGLNNRDTDRTQDIFHSYHGREMQLLELAEIAKAKRKAKEAAIEAGTWEDWTARTDTFTNEGINPCLLQFLLFSPSVIIIESLINYLKFSSDGSVVEMKVLVDNDLEEEWSVHYDEHTKRHYYYNTKRNETIWKNPMTGEEEEAAIEVEIKARAELEEFKLEDGIGKMLFQTFNREFRRTINFEDIRFMINPTTNQVYEKLRWFCK